MVEAFLIMIARIIYFGGEVQEKYQMGELSDFQNLGK
ncbi:MAG: hypothetical protein ACJAU0_002217 [Flavobacteriales bacterium]|jgi:hypothetical protein